MQLIFTLEFLSFSSDTDIIFHHLYCRIKQKVISWKLINNLRALENRSWPSVLLSNFESFSIILLTCPNLVKIINNSKHSPPQGMVNHRLNTTAGMHASHLDKVQLHILLCTTRNVKHRESNLNRRFLQVIPVYTILSVWDLQIGWLVPAATEENRNYTTNKVLCTGESSEKSSLRCFKLGIYNMPDIWLRLKERNKLLSTNMH